MVLAIGNSYFMGFAMTPSTNKYKSVSMLVIFFLIGMTFSCWSLTRNMPITKKYQKPLPLRAFAWMILILGSAGL